MDSDKNKDKDVHKFHEMLTPFMKREEGVEAENILDSVLVHFIKDEAASGSVPISVLTHPVETVDQIIKEVQEAIKTKIILRVAGSIHSAHAAIFPKEPKKNKTLVLQGDLRKIETIKEVKEDGKKYLYCRVGAGCNLGKNPMDILHSTWENSACCYISKLGYCFPELGGIIHQTIGGFILTGSAGGSLMHGFADVIREIEFVDGTGKVQVAKPNTDLWCAVGVSMGLFGIVTHVTFRLPEAKLIKGSETGYEFVDSPLGPDKAGKSRLRENLETHEYFRVNWFPQKEVNRVQEWSGKQVDSGEIVPYHTVLSCPLAAGMAAIVLSTYDYILQMPNPDEFYFKVVGAGLKQFVPIESKPFCDVFYSTLPMDNYAHVDTIILVDFTEIWMPIDQCQTVMDKLQALFQNSREAAGNFATEMYAAKESPFWLSMSYGGPMVRVDPYWWAYNRGDLRNFFTLYWNVLLEIPGTRLHWGKYLPLPGQKCGTATFNLEYLKKVYPRMEDWLAKRKEMDPHQIFVTDYWRGILEIPDLPAK